MKFPTITEEYLLSDKVKQEHQNLIAARKELEAVMSTLAEKENELSKFEGLSEDIATLLIEKEELHKSIADLSEEVESAQLVLSKEISTYNAMLNAANNECLDLVNQNKELKQKNSELVDSNNQLSADVNAFKKELSELKEAHSIEILDFKNTKESLKKEVAVLNSEKTVLAKNIASTQVSIDKLKHDSTELANTKTQTLIELSQLNENKNKLVSEVQALTSTIENLKTEHALSTKTLLAEKESLESKAGELSLKESILLDKEEKLKKAKLELEKHFNKPMKHIII